MNEIEELSNPKRYKIYIQIKKNRRLRRNAKYLNKHFDFTEDINQAVGFPDIQSAEDTLAIVSKLKSNETRPRIIIKYLIPSIGTEEKISNGV